MGRTLIHENKELGCCFLDSTGVSEKLRCLGSRVSSGDQWSVQFCYLCHVRLFLTPLTEARHASLSFTNSRSLLKLMPIESEMPSNHRTLCHPLLLPSIFPSIRVFSSGSVLRIRWPKYWSFSFSINPSNKYLGLISFRIDWFDLLDQW